MSKRQVDETRVRIKNDRYLAALHNLPPSGGGGCHPALLGVANYGRMAGLSPDQIARDLAEHAHGTRKVTEREIRTSVARSFDSPSRGGLHPNVQPAALQHVVDGPKLLKKILDRCSNFTEVDLWEASPTRIDWPPEDDASEVLRRLYRPDDRLFIGSRFEAGPERILPVSDWIERFSRHCAVFENIIPNPLTGKEGSTQDGKVSFRADSCVAQFRYAVVEFDSMPREQQIQFWAGVKLPVVALLDSGGKSIHGWVRINASNTEEWTHRVESKLFNILTAVGADPACKNEARLSRMPGHFRIEKGRWQRVLYLNPAGAPILP